MSGITGAARANPVRYGQWGVDLAGMDKSVKPGDDFFSYVNGTWARDTPIPGDKSSYGSFTEVRDLSEARVQLLIKSYLDGTPASGSDQATIATLYRTFMDEAAIEKQDSRPLLVRLQPIKRVNNKEDLARLMAKSIGGFGSSLFALTLFDDARNPDRNALYIGQSGLGLSDRDLYFNDKFKLQKERYQRYVAQLLSLSGWPRPEEAANKIVTLETRIAEAHWTRAETRDRDKFYSPMTPTELERHAPGFPWRAYWQAAGVAHAKRAIVSQKTAVPKLAEIFATTDLQTLKAWQAFHTTDDMSPLLSKRFVDANFEFRSRFSRGQLKQRERWKRGLTHVQNAMGEAIGRDYVRLYFNADAKQKMDRLVSDLKTAMRNRLERLSWMSSTTKGEALKKLANFKVKIGHPEEWRDYSGFRVIPGDLVGNFERAGQFEWRFRRAKIDKPVDKAEWGILPQTASAYYSPVKNEIVFPAAILQPPFFDPAADPSVNYGAIGGVIGHEIIHAFDDQGRKTDSAGVLRDWWQPDDAAKFEAEAAKLGKQYAAIEFPTLPGMRIDPRVAMGENIADLGGVELALEAYRNYLGGKPGQVLDGFTPEQRVFMAWAQVWRTLWRDDALRQEIITGPHSPGHIRAFAPLRNVAGWYKAFDVQPEQKLYLPAEERARIW